MFSCNFAAYFHNIQNISGGLFWTSNIYSISSYWENLTFSKLRFSKLKNLSPGQLFASSNWLLRYHHWILPLLVGIQKSEVFVKNRVRLFSNLCFFFEMFHFKQNYCTLFFCNKIVTHESKGISLIFSHGIIFNYDYYKGLSHFQKALIIKTMVLESSNWANLW